MAVQTTPYVVSALSHSAELFRRTFQTGLPLGSAGGVVPATPAVSANLAAGVAGCSDLAVTAPASGMSVNIAAGQAVVCGTLGSGSGYGIGKGYGMPTVTLNGGSAPTVASGANATSVQLTTQGAYYCYNDNSSGAVNLAIAASNPTNPRIDVVIAQVEDAQYSGSNNDWKLAVVTGTAAASPTVPTLPANALVLAYVWVPANATNIVAGDILDLRVAYNRNPFVARMYRSAAYTLTASSGVVFPFDTVHYDLTGSCTTGASAKFTVPVQGIYKVSGGYNIASSTTPRVTLEGYRNGAEVARIQDITVTTAVSAAYGSFTYPFTPNDTAQLVYFSNNAAAINTGIAFNYMTVELVTPL